NIIRVSPPTSPQHAWNAGRQAERDQRTLGSPPSRRHPAYPSQMPQNIADALRHHPPVPVDQYPGIPRHQIERIHRLHSPPPPPPHPMFAA
ncbi:hypothetical protein J3R83DRAFT_9081, partial [Lanmaoa asiatica]